VCFSYVAFLACMRVVWLCAVIWHVNPLVIHVPSGRMDDSQLHVLRYGYQKLFTWYYFSKFIKYVSALWHELSLFGNSDLKSVIATGLATKIQASCIDSEAMQCLASDIAHVHFCSNTLIVSVKLFLSVGMIESPKFLTNIKVLCKFKVFGVDIS